VSDALVTRESESGAREVVVFDYGFGNVRSAVRALQRAGADVRLSADLSAALAADGLVVPGVGAFAACMAGLVDAGGDTVVRERVAGGRPVLGICVGMQVLFESGSEHGHETAGLGLLPGRVERLHAARLPHMGWNTVAAAPAGGLFSPDADDRFYFVHSYGVRADPGPRVNSSWTRYGGDRFLAAVEAGPLAATQFHPEKSGDAGAGLLRRWLAGVARVAGDRSSARSVSPSHH